LLESLLRENNAALAFEFEFVLVAYMGMKEANSMLLVLDHL